MSTKTTTAKKNATTEPAQPNFSFERHAATLQRAKSQMPASNGPDASVATDTAHQNSESAASSPPSRAEDAAFIRERLHQATGIAALVATCYAPDSLPDERPSFEDLYGSLDVARGLLRECTQLLHGNYSSIGCRSDKWIFEVEGSLAMLDMFDKIHWASCLTPVVNDSELGGFLDAARDAMRRAYRGLEADLQAKTSAFSAAA